MSFIKQQHFLLLIVFIQWVFLALVLIDRYHQNEKVDVGRLLETFKGSASKNIKRNKPGADTDQQRLETRQKFEGVSVNLMLDSPRWFQRRYTALVSNVLVNTPRDWAVQIFYTPGGQSQIGLDINPGLVRLTQIYKERLILTPLPLELLQKFGTKRKLKYWTDKWMWENMAADKVFTFGGNGAMCGNSRRLSFLDSADSSSSSAILFFNQLDYVGTPWRQFYGRGGDGAFSYRNRTAMILATQYNPHDGSTDETTYFIKTLLDMNEKLGTSFRVATKEQSVFFGGASYSNNSTETEFGPPLVIAGTLSELDTSHRERMLEWCPEIKLIFPALHDPFCFGAEPNSEKCAKSICALKDSKERPGGC